MYFIFRVVWCLGWSTIVPASVACDFFVNDEISCFSYVSRKRRDAWIVICFFDLCSYPKITASISKDGYVTMRTESCRVFCSLC
jgi:hypothetical protein